ncbi:MAG: cohesin domain-containing protein [Brevefilum sp.]
MSPVTPTPTSTPYGFVASPTAPASLFPSPLPGTEHPAGESTWPVQAPGSEAALMTETALENPMPTPGSSHAGMEATAQLDEPPKTEGAPIEGAQDGIETLEESQEDQPLRRILNIALWALLIVSVGCPAGDGFDLDSTSTKARKGFIVMKRMETRLVVLALLLLGLVFAPLGDAFAQGQTSARGGIFKDVELKPDGRAEVPVEIRGVNELYAADIEIRFDPNVIQIEDANPDVDGIQPALGTFLDAGLVLYNRVDNQEGLVQFVMTQANPSEPKSGDGILLVLYVVGCGARRK